jgi:hypothetical protein
VHVVVDQGHEPVLGESAEVASHDAFGGSDGSGDASGLGTRVGRDVRETIRSWRCPRCTRSSPKRPAAQTQRHRAVERAA